MLTFGLGEILLVFLVIIIIVGPKDIPKLIKQLSSLTKSIKKLSREFKSSLNEIADQEEFKDMKSSLNEVKKIKDDLDIRDNLKSEFKSLKDTSNIIEKEVKELKKISSNK